MKVKGKATVSFEFDADIDVDALAEEYVNDNLGTEFDFDTIDEAELVED